jgi:prophage regulatory protein
LIGWNYSVIFKRRCYMPTTILRFPSVRAATGCSRTTIHRRIHDGLFPRPVNLGAKAVGWPAHEIEAINTARIAGQSNEQVRALVQRLHAARKGEGVRG